MVNNCISLGTVTVPSEMQGQSPISVNMIAVFF